MIPPQPYIGITGFVSDDDILCAAECAETVRAVVPSHRLMAGVLVSWRGLAGIQHTSRRYPRIETVDGILRKLLHAGCWPVVHYNTSNNGAEMRRELERLAEKLPAMFGLQLNVVRPDPAEVASFAAQHPEVEVILQVNTSSLGVGPAAISPGEYIARYDGIRHALLDASGGTGKRIVPEGVAATIRSTFDVAVDRGVRLGFAGGLGPDCGTALAHVRRELEYFHIGLEQLSVDAESGVRSPAAASLAIPGEKHQDDLDRAKAREYTLDAASIVMRG
jgi:hypothetical protein